MPEYALDLELEQQMMEFLSGDAEICTFMNPENFEQLEIPRAVLGPPTKKLLRLKRKHNIRICGSHGPLHVTSSHRWSAVRSRSLGFR